MRGRESRKERDLLNASWLLFFFSETQEREKKKYSRLRVTNFFPLTLSCFHLGSVRNAKNGNLGFESVKKKVLSVRERNFNPWISKKSLVLNVFPIIGEMKLLRGKNKYL